MRISTPWVASLALVASSAASAGPLQQHKPGAALPRIASVARAMPALSVPSPVRAGAALPGLNAVCVRDQCLPPIGGGGGGNGPLQQYWIQYNVNEYPDDVRNWHQGNRAAVVDTVAWVYTDVTNPCYGEGSCGPSDDPVGYVSKVPGVVSSAQNRILGLIGGGGVGPIPLPKRPGEQPPLD